MTGEFMEIILVLTLWQQALRWVFLLGFFFLVGVGVWAIIVIARVRRDQEVATVLLHVLVERAKLQDAVGKLLVAPPGGHSSRGHQ